MVGLMVVAGTIFYDLNVGLTLHFYFIALEVSRTC